VLYIDRVLDDILKIDKIFIEIQKICLHKWLNKSFIVIFKFFFPSFLSQTKMRNVYSFFIVFFITITSMFLINIWELMIEVTMWWSTIDTIRQEINRCLPWNNYGWQGDLNPSTIQNTLLTYNYHLLPIISIKSFGNCISNSIIIVGHSWPL